MVAPSKAPAHVTANSATGRMAAVQDMAKLQRILFEVEREFIRTATTLIYRVGEPELKYLLCQHVWESAGHARFLRERGRELSGFGNGDEVRDTIRRVFSEAVMASDGYVALAGFYRVLKPALLGAYQHYLRVTDHLADWPSKKLVEEFVADEERHAREIAPFLAASVVTNASDWTAHLSAAVSDHGGFCGENVPVPLPLDFRWRSAERSYTHPATCNRGKYPTCSSVFGFDPAETPIVRPWLVDPKTDARVVR